MSDTPGRLTAIGEQVLAARPDTGVGCATLVGEQILTAAPPQPVRVSASMLELLVSGTYQPPGQVTTVGEQVLAAAPPQPVRVSASMLELLVSGAYQPPGQVTTVGEQVLAAAPPQPVRVSASMLELLITDTPKINLAPGQVRSANLQASAEAAYLPVDSPQSDVTVRRVIEQVAEAGEIETTGSEGRLFKADLIASAVSSILFQETATRLYASWLTSTARTPDWLSPDVPQSDSFVSAVQQALAGALRYPDALKPWSDLIVGAVARTTAQQANITTPGSDLTASNVDQRLAQQADITTPGSDLTASNVDQRLAQSADYPTRFEVLAQLHSACLITTAPAGWIGDYKTQLRAHGFSLQSTLPSPAGVYINPILVLSSIEASSVVNTLALESKQPLGGLSDAFVNRVVQQAAVETFYDDPDAPQSRLTVNTVDVLVVQKDATFGDFAPRAQSSVPVVSIQLLYP